jgi:hypothetical protein
MQRAKTLTRILRQLAELVAEEAETNPAFAEKLDAVLASIPAGAPKTGKSKAPAIQVPDVFAEYQARGDDEFRFWLRGLEVPTLRAIVKANGFDPGKQSVRWTEPEKFASLIADQLKAQLRRGSAFMPPRGAVDGGTNTPVS